MNMKPEFTITASENHPNSENFTPAPGFHPENIPVELTSLPQFVCWHYVTRNGKPTKPPVDAKSNGELLNARTNDHGTWSDFTTAVATAERLKLAGIGLALSEQDGLTGLDLDHVFNPETGEIDPLAANVLERFSGTYAEISPSGNGIRIWCYGKPQRSGKCIGKVKWLEVYSHPSNRYLTVTGNPWAGSATAVTEQQEALDWLHQRFMMASTGGKKARPAPSPSVDTVSDLDDHVLLNKARQSKDGAAFEALWSGDTSAHGEDHSSADLALLNRLAFWTNSDSARMDRLFRQSGLMRAKWDERHGEATYGQASIAKAIAGCREGYSGKRPAPAKPAREPASVSATSSATPDEPRLDPFRGTDDANAALLLQRHGADIRYCPPWEKWLLWTGSHWRIDDQLTIEKLSADVPRQLRTHAAALLKQVAEIAARCHDLVNIYPVPPEYLQLREKQKNLTAKVDRVTELAGKLEATYKRNGMLLAARHQVVILHTDLDKGHYLLNCQNGTLDLTTGRLRPHDRADLLTHDCEIPYRADATCPNWLAFLWSTFNVDLDLIAFIQRAIGYSLTGDVKEQVFLLCHGVGSNGKSVFLNILRKLLGRLAIQAAPDLLMQDKNRRHPTEQADLFSKRLVVCQETEEGRRFNETLVKQLTGGDGIRTRRMHEDFWEFNPTHKIWLSTNHKPEIRGTDHAIWRRIRLIPFNVKFTDEGPARKDPDMEAKLTAELPGILAWAVQGCLAWQREGLKPAVAVVEATQNYQEEQDVLAAWFADCCVIKKHCETRASELYASYTAWCDRSGEYPEKQRKFGMRLKDRGFEQFTSNGAWWRGIGLLSPRSTEGTEPTEGNSAFFAIKNMKNDILAKYADSGSVPSVPSVDQKLKSPPVEFVPPQPLRCTWNAAQRLVTKCAAPDVQRDSTGGVVGCKHCGGVL